MQCRKLFWHRSRRKKKHEREFNTSICVMEIYVHVKFLINEMKFYFKLMPIENLSDASRIDSSIRNFTCPAEKLQ